MARTKKKATGKQTHFASHQSPRRTEYPAKDLSVEDLTLDEVVEDDAMGAKTEQDLPADAEIIQVNLAYPEKNGPFTIFSAHDFEGIEKNKVYPGFAIFIEHDVRYSLDSKRDEVEYYNARVFSPTKLLIRVPSWEYCLSSTSDWRCFVGHVQPNLMNAIDAARNKFHQEEKETRMWRHYVLDFGT
jgi:hypothetical protein